ncbi:MAG: Na+/H+ antiporter NhaA [Acidimicrobiaceae bacterium]|nr:Na+/H+ antiporter NhaA [Acidimicrobiaceae bacterium]
MAHRTPHSTLTWLGSDRPLARVIGRPMLRFLSVEAAGGIVLVAATIIALAWANSPWSAGYGGFWHSEVHLAIGDWFTLEHDGHPLTLAEVVNDVVMVLFFLVVGLEIKRELMAGELRRPRAALLPAVAALGGMVVPAAAFLLFNPSGDPSTGWGIPMATDIAFAVGILSLLGNRVPTPLKVFLLTLAIVDDIGAIVVIAIFYTGSLEAEWLVVAAAVLVAVRVLTKMRVWYTPIYVGLGLLLWYATFESGIHATLAGVAMGLLAPATPLTGPEHASEAVQPIVDGEVDADTVRRAGFLLGESVSVAERIEHLLHPLTSLVVIPIFALANAGIELSGDSLADAVGAPVTLGVVFGLVVGKTVGVSVFTLLAVRFRLSALPAGAAPRHIVGVAAISGIGFTVSLFITNLAYDSPLLRDEAKIGVLAASIVAGVIGSTILYRSKPAAIQPAADVDCPPVGT